MIPKVYFYHVYESTRRLSTMNESSPPAVCVCAHAFAPAQPGGAGRPRRRLFRSTRRVHAVHAAAALSSLPRFQRFGSRVREARVFASVVEDSSGTRLPPPPPRDFRARLGVHELTTRARRRVRERGAATNDARLQIAATTTVRSVGRSRLSRRVSSRSRARDARRRRGTRRVVRQDDAVTTRRDDARRRERDEDRHVEGRGRARRSRARGFAREGDAEGRG